MLTFAQTVEVGVRSRRRLKHGRVSSFLLTSLQLMVNLASDVVWANRTPDYVGNVTPNQKLWRYSLSLAASSLEFWPLTMKTTPPLPKTDHVKLK